MMQGTNATAARALIVSQFTASSILAYNILTLMQKYLYQIIKTLPLALLLAACATSNNNTPAPIVAGQASTVGSISKAKPARADTIKPAAATTSGTQTSPIRLGSTPRPNAVPASGATTHVVEAGETLYRIAVNNGQRYQDLAEWNNLDGYTIKVGQVLRLTPPGKTGPAENKVEPAKVVTPVVVGSNSAKHGGDVSKQYPKALKLPYSETALKQLPQQAEDTASVKVLPPVAVAKVTPPAATTEKPVVKPAEKPAGNDKSAASAPTPADTASGTASAAGSASWLWPTQGKVSRGFSDQNKGINITGKLGQPVLAANSGKVVYSGAGLRGYGKLIIIRHDKTYLSAYAHNSMLAVKEGQSVKRGQKIAEMGDSDSDQVKLHFEIREMGKPVDPSKFLEAKP